ncbi:MAG: GIY-YIG nuclease family protein [Deltaproteobacteria bacterium]|nr:GIY-YIG nuclease family protein [Deltaproteobacteria bacterium]
MPYGPGRPSRQPPPHAPGEYRWVNKETKERDYIGETNDLARRKGEHERSDKPVDSSTHTFEWKEADPSSTSESRREHERKKIAQHHPPLNQRGGGGGRPSGR